MLKKLLQAICLAISIITQAQPVQHTINYSSSGLPTSLCNVFNTSPAQVIGSYTHYPVSGGVTFDGTNLVLKTQYATSPISSNLGTAYAIEFPFQAGYSYSFQFTAKGTDGSGGNTNFPFIMVSLFNSLPDPIKQTRQLAVLLVRINGECFSKIFLAVFILNKVQPTIISLVILHNQPHHNT